MIQNTESVKTFDIDMNKEYIFDVSKANAHALQIASSEFKSSQGGFTFNFK